MSSTALMNPGDITDAADSTDLLEQLKLTNTMRVEDELDARTRAEMRKQREREIWEGYKSKASDYYDGIWTRCGTSRIGHRFISFDTGSETISVCDTCSFAEGIEKNTGRTDYNGRPIIQSSRSDANEYKENMIRGLAKQLMALDEETGVLIQPQDDDFIGLESKYGQKSKKWRR